MYVMHNKDIVKQLFFVCTYIVKIQLARYYGYFVKQIIKLSGNCITTYLGRRFCLLFSCVGAIICIELATLSFLLKDLFKDPLIKGICDYTLLVSIPMFMVYLEKLNPDMMEAEER